MNSELQLTINYPASLSNNPLFFEEYAKFLRSIKELSEDKNPQTGRKVPQSPQVVFKEACTETGNFMTYSNPNLPTRENKKTPYTRRRRDGPTLNREVPIVSPNTGFTPVYRGDRKNRPVLRDTECPARESLFETDILDAVQLCTARSFLLMFKEGITTFLEKYTTQEQSEKVYGVFLEVLKLVENKKLYSIGKIIKDVDVISALLKVI